MFWPAMLHTFGGPGFTVMSSQYEIPGVEQEGFLYVSRATRHSMASRLPEPQKYVKQQPNTSTKSQKGNEFAYFRGLDTPQGSMTLNLRTFTANFKSPAQSSTSPKEPVTQPTKRYRLATAPSL